MNAIEKNPNTSVTYIKGYRGYDDETYIEIEPYNRELNIDYVLYWIKKIKKTYKHFILNFHYTGYRIDGLLETNNSLIYNGSILSCMYTGQYRTIKFN